MQEGAGKLSLSKFWVILQRTWHLSCTLPCGKVDAFVSIRRFMTSRGLHAEATAPKTLEEPTLWNILKSFLVMVKHKAKANSKGGPMLWQADDTIAVPKPSKAKVSTFLMCCEVLQLPAAFLPRKCWSTLGCSNRRVSSLGDLRISRLGKGYPILNRTCQGLMCLSSVRSPRKRRGHSFLKHIQNDSKCVHGMERWFPRLRFLSPQLSGIGISMADGNDLNGDRLQVAYGDMGPHIFSFVLRRRLLCKICLTPVRLEKFQTCMRVWFLSCGAISLNSTCTDVYRFYTFLHTNII